MRQRERTVGGEEGRRIGADRIEGDEAQIEQAGDADFEIEAHAHEDEEPDHQQHLADEIAGIERKQHGQDRGGGEIGPADVAPGRGGSSVEARRDLSLGAISRG